MEFQDRTLNCRDCGQPFVFTAGEQGFYIEKGLMNLPQRCPTCRANRRTRGAASPESTSTITCARCGKEATVPFVPRLDRPVYCDDCFSSVRAEKAPVSA
jgi:CxxC-x17-CxxC domain-containing protein